MKQHRRRPGPQELVVEREPRLPVPDDLRGTGGRALDPETSVSLPDRGKGNGPVHHFHAFDTERMRQQ